MKILKHKNIKTTPPFAKWGFYFW